MKLFFITLLCILAQFSSLTVDYACALETGYEVQSINLNSYSDVHHEDGNNSNSKHNQCDHCLKCHQVFFFQAPQTLTTLSSLISTNIFSYAYLYQQPYLLNDQKPPIV